DVLKPPDMTALYAVLVKVDAVRSAREASESASQIHDSSGWESDVNGGLKALDEIEPSRFDCYACAYTSKMSVLFAYFDEVPDKRWKERILSDLVRNLADQEMEKEAPVEWLFYVDILLNTARKPSAEQQQEIRRLEKAGKAPNGLPSVLGAEIRQAMMRSGDNTLYLYAHADEVLQTQYLMPPHPD